MNQKIIDKIVKFNEDRNWDQFHNGKDLALSLSLEASELLEIYQWSGTDLMCSDKIEAIKEELADILIYAIQISQVYNLNIDDIILNKISKNELKYPISKSINNSKKYSKLS